MKKISTFAALLLMAAAAMFSTSCENDNINPYDYVKMAVMEVMAMRTRVLRMSSQRRWQNIP